MLTTVSRVGELERYLDNPLKAKQYIEDSIRWRKKYFGNYHHFVAEGFHQLGYLLQGLEKPESAVQVYSVAVTILSAVQKVQIETKPCFKYLSALIYLI